jgi:hypothetical protein
MAEQIFDGFDPSYSDVLLVYVGGGEGHDVLEFWQILDKAPLPLRKSSPARPGPVFAASETPIPPFEAQAHDFFAPQPVKARAYSLHSILHGWSDEKGIRILENLKPTLKPDDLYALLYEIAMSEEKPDIAATDMGMMRLPHMNEGERTEKHWRDVASKAGYKVVGIYNLPSAAERVTELGLWWVMVV